MQQTPHAQCICHKVFSLSISPSYACIVYMTEGPSESVAFAIAWFRRDERYFNEKAQTPALEPSDFKIRITVLVD